MGDAAMKADSPETDAERLLQLSEELIRIAGLLTQLPRRLGQPLGLHCPRVHLSVPDDLIERVSWLIHARRIRSRYLAPELLAEPAWDILLELLRAELVQEQLSIAAVCTAAGVPASTGLRWLNALEHRGLVVRQDNSDDVSRTLVVLSSEGSLALQRYFLDVAG